MASDPLQSGVYFIQNIGTGTVVDLANGSSTDGTIVQGWAKRELSDGWVPAQLWVISQISQVGTNPVYTIENATSRTYLDLRDKTDGTAVLGYGATNADSQKWVITRANAKNSYVIANKQTGTYVDLTGGNANNGTKIQGWTGPGGATAGNNQLWLIIRA